MVKGEWHTSARLQHLTGACTLATESMTPSTTSSLSSRVTFSLVITEGFEELPALRIAAMSKGLERVDWRAPARIWGRLRKTFYPECRRCVLPDGKNIGSYTLRPVGGRYPSDQPHVHSEFESRGMGSHVSRQRLAPADGCRFSKKFVALKAGAANRFYERRRFSKTTEAESDIYDVCRFTARDSAANHLS